MIPAAQASKSTPAELRDAVENALARLILRHGALRVGVVGEDTNKPSFVSLPSVSLHDVMEWRVAKQGTETVDSSDSEVLKALRDRLEQVWPDTQRLPLWKLIIVQHPRPHEATDVVLDVIFATHHAICDGKSTTLLHTVLLEEMNRGRGPPPELTNHVLRFNDPPILAPSQEELIDLSISWTYFFKTLWAEFGPGWPKPPVRWTGNPVALAPNGLNLRVVTIPPDAVPLILDACRSHSTTFTALLHALVACSLAARLPAEEATAFKSSTPVSTQPFANLPPGVDLDLSKTVADLNTGMTHAIDPPAVAELRQRGRGVSSPDSHDDEEGPVWRLAETVRLEIKKRVDTFPADDVVGLMAWIRDWRKRWLNMIGKPRGETWSVSNIGSPSYNSNGNSNGNNDNGNSNSNDDTGSGGWRIQRSIFTQPAMVVGPAFGVNVSGVKGGVITLTLNWQEGIVEGELIEGVAGDLRRWLMHLKETGRLGVFSGSN